MKSRDRSTVAVEPELPGESGSVRLQGRKNACAEPAECTGRYDAFTAFTMRRIYGERSRRAYSRDILMFDGSTYSAGRRPERTPLKEPHGCVRRRYGLPCRVCGNKMQLDVRSETKIDNRGK